MSKKKKLLDMINDFDTCLNNLSIKAQDIKKSEDMTESFKITKLFEVRGQIKNMAKEKAMGMYVVINKAILEKTTKKNDDMRKRANNPGYQIGISNLLKAIELGSYDMNTINDIAKEIYADDVNALKLIQGAIESSNIPHDGFFLDTTDHTEITLSRLRSTKDNIKRYIEDVQFEHDFNSSFSSGLGIVGIREFVQLHLDDDLNYIK